MQSQINQMVHLKTNEQTNKIYKAKKKDGLAKMTTAKPHSGKYGNKPKI